MYSLFCFILPLVVARAFLFTGFWFAVISLGFCFPQALWYGERISYWSPLTRVRNPIDSDDFLHQSKQNKLYRIVRPCQKKHVCNNWLSESQCSAQYLLITDMVSSSFCAVCVRNCARSCTPNSTPRVNSYLMIHEEPLEKAASVW